MAKENRVVELIGTGEDNIIQPYFDVTLTGGLAGYDHVHADGHVVIEGRPTGTITLADFAEGRASFDAEGNLIIQTTPGSWRQAMFGDWTAMTTQGGRVLNIYRGKQEE